jgi:hypothetical protein
MNHAHNHFPTPSAIAGVAVVRAGGNRRNAGLLRMAHRTASLPTCRGVSR